MNGSYEEETVATAGDRIVAVHANDRDAVSIQGEIHEDSSMAKQVSYFMLAFCLSMRLYSWFGYVYHTMLFVQCV